MCQQHIMTCMQPLTAALHSQARPEEGDSLQSEFEHGSELGCNETIAHRPLAAVWTFAECKVACGVRCELVMVVR